MKYCFLLAALLVPSVLWGQCANTAYGSFTCVQSPNPVQNSGTVVAAQIALSFAAPTTAGNGVLIFGSFCTANNNCNGTTVPPPAVTITDDVMDTGFQPCASNGSTGNNVRFWYCWWLPSVGAARTFTMHAAGSYSATLSITEFAGGCNVSSCIGTSVPSVFCMGPCGAQITTIFTNVLVASMGYEGGVLINSGAGWLVMSSSTAGHGIASFQAVTGPYTPMFTNTTMLQAVSVGIKARSGSISTQITIPTMPVF